MSGDVPLLAGSLSPWGFVGALLASIAAVVLVYQHFQARPVKHVPGPFSFPFVGNVPHLMNRPWARVLQYSKVHGGIFKVFVWGSPFLFVSDPDAIKRIFVTNHKNYAKDPWSYKLFGRILGKGLVTSEGPLWKAERALLSPAFHTNALGRLIPCFSQAGERLVKSLAALKPGQPVEICAAYRELTLEIISEITLGLSPSESHVFPELFVSVIDEMNLRVFQPYRQFFPSNLEHVRKLDRLDSLMSSMIKARRAAPRPEPVDLLDVLLTASFVDEVQVADELKTMLLAGHETSSLMLTWTTYLLATHPEALAKAVAEVDATFDALASGSASTGTSAAPVDAAVTEDGNEDGAPSNLPAVVPGSPFDRFRRMNYVLKCLKESLRVYTTVPALTREMLGDDVLCGHHIPAGTKIVIDIWSSHHNEKVWGPDVEEFRPERFDEAEARGRHPFAFCPFSLGSRNCVGQHLALLEGQVVLGYLLRHYTIRLMPNHPSVETLGFLVPVRPENGVFIVVEPRRATGK